MIRVIMNIYECADNSGVTLVRKQPGMYPSTTVFSIKEEEEDENDR